MWHGVPWWGWLLIGIFIVMPIMGWIWFALVGRSVLARFPVSSGAAEVAALTNGAA